MTVYTPDEQLHRQHALDQQRDRFLVRYYLTGHKPIERKAFARQVESTIAARLRDDGYSVTRSGANAHFDLLVNGLRIEVKAAALSDGHRYQASLRKNDSDVLILCCRAPLSTRSAPDASADEGRGAGGEGDEGGMTDHFFVIPFDEVRGRTHVKINGDDPTAYTGRFRVWYDAWQLIDQLIAAGVNHWQPALL